MNCSCHIVLTLVLVLTGAVSSVRCEGQAAQMDCTSSELIVRSDQPRKSDPHLKCENFCYWSKKKEGEHEIFYFHKDGLVQAWKGRDSATTSIQEEVIDEAQVFRKTSKPEGPQNIWDVRAGYYQLDGPNISFYLDELASLPSGYGRINYSGTVNGNLLKLPLAHEYQCISIKARHK